MSSCQIYYSFNSLSRVLSPENIKATYVYSFALAMKNMGLFPQIVWKISPVIYPQFGPIPAKLSPDAK